MARSTGKKMKPGSKFITSVAVILTCSFCGIIECSAVTESYITVVALGVFSTLGGNHVATAFPPFLQKRLGSPTPQIGSGPPVSFEDEESEEDEDDLLESMPRVEPQITSINRDQCLAKLLCGMSVPVTGGNSKKTYYNEYAQIVSKFFEAFPLDDEYQSKESIETYDDYSNEDEKPKRMNSRRKPLNSSRVEATAPTLQLFDLALVDVAKPEDKNNTNAAIEKVSTGNRVARARKIVENLGQKLQTVRQCQSINGCPFTFKQLKEKLRKKEAQKIASNVPLPTPFWPTNPNRKQAASAPFKPKPERPARPIPPTQKPEPLSIEELFSNEDEPVFPYKDTHKGDDEMEEIFGSPSVSKKPLGFHQGVDHHFNYEYNPDKPWRPGGKGGNNYGYRPWKTRPQPNSHSSQQRPPQQRPPQQRPPQQRPRPVVGPPSRKKSPVEKPQVQQQQPIKQRPVPAVTLSKPVKPTPPSTTPRSVFPKKKISYLNSQYKKPSKSQDDDEDSDDINKVAPVELVGNFDAGEQEPKDKPYTTDQPQEVEEKNSKKKDENDDDDSDEYDDNDYYDDEYDEDDELQDDDDVDDDDNYSDEEKEDKEAEAKKTKRRKQQKEKRKRKKENAKKKKSEAEKEDEPKQKKRGNVGESSFDDENEGNSETWTKLNFATTGGANYDPPEKLSKSKEVGYKKTDDTNDDVSDEDDEDEEEDEEDARKGFLQKIRASSTSASTEDDDEVDDENAAKRKRNKSRGKSDTKKKPDEKSPGKESSDKDKKSKKKPSKKPSSDEEDNSSMRKNMLMEIGGRPLVPKPEADQGNSQKTSGLISNRFKLQLINPYGPGAPPAPPQQLDVNPHGSFSPLRGSKPTADSAPSGGVGSSLPFKFKINAGPLGNLASSFGGMGGGEQENLYSAGNQSPGSGSGSMEYVGIPNHHHRPPPQHHQAQFMPQQQQHYPPQQGFTGGSGLSNGLFKLNPIPALTNLFKRPSASSFDPMQSGGPQQGHAPPMNSFVHRPVGPESSQYRKERISPASGSSKGSKSKSKKGKGSKKGKF